MTRRSHLPSRPTKRRLRHAGFTLVELLVALVIGLVLVGGLINALLSTQQSVRLNESLARLQESGRFAVDLIARELREAGSNPCGSALSANVVARTGGVPPWWASTYSGFIQGFDGDEDATGIQSFGPGPGQRVEGTDAVLLLKGATDESALRTLASHVPSGTPQFIDARALSAMDAERFENAPVVVCDGRSAALLRVGNVNSVGKTYQISDAAGMNCTTDLGTASESCGGLSPKTFAAGAQMMLWDPGFWYVGHNGRGSRSLYRLGIAKDADGSIVTRVEEMAPDIVDMQIAYLTRDRNTGALATAWRDASDAAFSGGWVADTAEVTALQIRLTLNSPQPVGADGLPLTRHFVAVASVRSRDL